MGHLEGGLWEFEGGRPVGWEEKSGRWTHPNIARVLALAPDALENQIGEEEIFRFEDPVAPSRPGVPGGTVGGTGGQPQIDPDARVAPTALIGPGSRIGPGTEIEDGAVVWNSVLQESHVGPGSRIERSVLLGSRVGACTVVRSSRMTDSTLGEDSTAQAANLAHTRLAPKAAVGAFAELVNVTSEFAAILGGAMRSTQIGTYLMSMHMAGACSHLKAIPTVVAPDGGSIAVPAVPMLGGGALIRGTKEKPVEMECCFIGSNAIIEPNSYVGFGCFVLGTLGPNAGLLPFTVSTGGGSGKDLIGGVLGSLASTIITHFISWTFQATGPEYAAAVAQLVRQEICRGIRAIEWEFAKRSGSADPADDREDFTCYRSLSAYSDKQLGTGLNNYCKVLDSGAWEIQWDGERLRFSSTKGRWLDRGGSAFWKRC